MPVAENVINFQKKVECSRGLAKGICLRGLWHLNVSFTFRDANQEPKFLLPNQLYLQRISTTIPKTRKFGGGKALEWINNLADDYQVPILLFATPFSHEALNEMQLQAFYARRGYELIGENGLMKRDPMGYKFS